MVSQGSLPDQILFPADGPPLLGNQHFEVWFGTASWGSSLGGSESRWEAFGVGVRHGKPSGVSISWELQGAPCGLICQPVAWHFRSFPAGLESGQSSAGCPFLSSSSSSLSTRGYGWARE